MRCDALSLLVLDGSLSFFFSFSLSFWSLSLSLACLFFHTLSLFAPIIFLYPDRRERDREARLESARERAKREREREREATNRSLFKTPCTPPPPTATTYGRLPPTTTCAPFPVPGRPHHPSAGSHLFLFFPHRFARSQLNVSWANLRDSSLFSDNTHSTPGPILECGGNHSKREMREK